jgi:predicted kinase
MEWLLGTGSAAGKGLGSERAAEAAHDRSLLTAGSLQHPRQVTAERLRQRSVDIRAPEADVAQEVIIEFSEADDLTAIAKCAAKAEEDREKGGHQCLLHLYFPYYGNMG